MNIKKCPICEKIKEEKEKKIRNLSSKTYICKNHLKEAIIINSQIVELLDFENNKDCPLCILEEEITQNFQGEVKDLCLYHLRMLRHRIKEEDYKEITKKWEEYKNYLKDPNDQVELIFDLLTGCGRIIRK